MDTLRNMFKGILLYLSLILTLAFPVAAYSATVDLGLLNAGSDTGFESLLKVVDAAPGSGVAVDTFTFELAENSNVTFSLTNLVIGTGFHPFYSDLDALELAFGSDSLPVPDGVATAPDLTVFNLLAGTPYSFTVSGIPGGLFGGGLYEGSVQVTAVPLPAAFWLFGSALLGLIGIGRRRAVKQRS